MVDHTLDIEDLSDEMFFEGLDQKVIDHLHINGVQAYFKAKRENEIKFGEPLVADKKPDEFLRWFNHN